MPPSNIKFVVPAHPGYFLLHPIHGVTGEIKEACRTPVVAFAIDTDDGVHPVTVNEIEDRGDPSVLTPDGTVHSYGNAWEDEASWLAEQKAVGA